MNRILIATDGSEFAGEALEQGLAIAEELGALATVLYVRQRPSPYLGEPNYQDVLTKEARREQTVLEDAKRRARVHAGEVEFEVLEGDAVEEILNLARSRDADLIVVGSRGLGSISSLMLGSVSTAILHQADRPVLVAKTPISAAAAV
jgi:nucleotide-binding universal stress UspA family protein